MVTDDDTPTTVLAVLASRPISSLVPVTLQARAALRVLTRHKHTSAAYTVADSLSLTLAHPEVPLTLALELLSATGFGDVAAVLSRADLDSAALDVVYAGLHDVGNQVPERDLTLLTVAAHPATSPDTRARACQDAADHDLRPWLVPALEALPDLEAAGRLVSVELLGEESVDGVWHLARHATGGMLHQVDTDTKAAALIARTARSHPEDPWWEESAEQTWLPLVDAVTIATAVGT